MYLLVFMLTILILTALSSTKMKYIYLLMLYFSMCFTKFNDNSGLFFSESMFLDLYGFYLSILTIAITMYMFWVSENLIFLNQKPSYQITMLSLALILIFVFIMDSIWLFYVFFEFSLLPIFLMILGWGYQPERLAAGKSMIIYTVFASLPFLIMMICNSTLSSGSFYLILSNIIISTESNLATLIGLILILGFLVKFPLASWHMWLPKAHVEAPVGGSMILAGLMLKLGGIGMIRVMSMISENQFFSYFFPLYALLQSSLLAFLCMKQLDMKVLIAFSSVCHMAMAIAGILTQTKLGLLGALFILLAHGIASSGLFMAANTIYLRSASRSMIFTRGLMSCFPSFVIFWFFLCVANFGGPPSVNLLSEILALSSILNFNFTSVITIVLLTYFGAAYTLILYGTTAHSQISNSSAMKWEVSFQELTTLSSHILFSMTLIVLINFLAYTYISSFIAI